MRTVGSILFLLILVPATIVVFLVFSLKANLLTASFFKNELVRLRAYDLAEEQLAFQIGRLNLAGMPVTTEEVQRLAARALPPAWLQQNVEGTLDRGFAWFNDPREGALSLPIDLAAPKRELLAGVDALLITAFPRLPLCTSGNPGTLCRVQGMTVEELKAMLRQQGFDLVTLAGQIPDTFDLANPVLPTIALGAEQSSPDESSQKNESKEGEQRTPESETQQRGTESPADSPHSSNQSEMPQIVENLEQARIIYRQAVRIWSYVLLGYAALVLLYLLLQLHGWRRFVRWTGILAVTIGFLPLLVSAASAPALEQALLPNLNLAQLPQEIQPLVPSVLRDVQRALFLPVLVGSASLVLFGIGAIVGAQFLPKRAKVSKD